MVQRSGGSFEGSSPADLGQRIAELEARLAVLDRDREAARTEIEAFRRQLDERSAGTVANAGGATGLPAPRTPEEKIRLFRSLFTIPESLLTMPRNQRSRWAGTASVIRVESAFDRRGYSMGSCMAH